MTTLRKTAMFIFACCVLPIMFVTRLQNIWAVVGVIGLAGAAHQAWSANLFTTVSDVSQDGGNGNRTLGGGGIGGGIPLSHPDGEVAGIYLKLHNATGGYAILFGICGIAYLVVSLHHFLAPKFEADRIAR